MGISTYSASDRILIRKVLLTWIVTVITSNTGKVQAKTPIYIGGFFPLSPNKASVPGYALLAAARLALNHVSKSGILRDYELKIIVKDSRVSCFIHGSFIVLFVSEKVDFMD